MNFKKLLTYPTVILDGAMGTMIQKRKLDFGINEELNITHPEEIIKIHREYIQSGAKIIYANTFGANKIKLENSKYSTEEIVKAGIKNAKIATQNTDTLVALDIGSVGKLLEPMGTMRFEEAYNVFKEIVLCSENADLIVIETMTDLYEMKAAILAAKENTSLPIIATMSFEENSRTFMGNSVSEISLTLEGLGADVIGINCSLGPDKMIALAEEMMSFTNLPLLIRPNAGLPDPVSGVYDVSPESYAQSMKELASIGVQFLGGCCGTTPLYIEKMYDAVKNVIPKRKPHKECTAVCSGTKTVLINQPRVIGERINPTGKKLFKQALIENNMNYVLSQGLEQINAGAEILDVNVGIPEIDEKEMMVKSIKMLQSIIDAPLQIDSTNADVLENALRVYNGKPIVNSVNGKEESMNSVLPLVKKYGAAVVALTLDENGIPKTAKERTQIAKRIQKKALSLGIKKEDIIFDCLTLTVSAEPDAVFETLNAMKYIKEEMGHKTILGVSNISFGLPNRELVNQNFLTSALCFGLDLPIINPNIPSMMGAVHTFKLLKNFDKNGENFISQYGNIKSSQTSVKEEKTIDLPYAISNGLVSSAKEITEKLLEKQSAMEVINDILIPALDNAGSAFEKGEIFLPQLIAASNVAQASFEVIKNKMKSDNTETIFKGKIILATVKGDVHDIGKNIVKVLLENYGYDVIDLGKDVAPQSVLECAKKENVHLIGLSALMTTTLTSMEDTIKLIKENNLDCKIMVGGAVLTEDYAKKIGADFYGKDAKSATDFARSVFN